jgi:hypothetical protein
MEFLIMARWKAARMYVELDVLSAFLETEPSIG